ncbi:MAG: NERD domain-containing protein [Sulfuriflexus sp.]|nr:NERD domain-containing protein [Sulfuriflexus sp.]
MYDGEVDILNMIIKDKDESTETVAYLSDLLERDLPDDKKRLIERELKMLRSGNKGEEGSAYYLNFLFKRKQNWVVIHDLRIEHDGDVAQIDHLVIGRALDIYVIESKNFTSGVAISDEGDFSYFYKGKPYAIPSPIEQNARHIQLLNHFLEDNDLLPTRLGMTIKPKYRNIVLISPTSRLSKPKKGLFDCSAVMKSDRFAERFNKDVDDISMLKFMKVVLRDTLILFANKLIEYHQPLLVDYLAKFGLESNAGDDEKGVGLDRLPESGNTTKKVNIKRSKFFCAKCKVDISEKVAKFCFSKKKRFDGKAYCFECQKSYS